MHIAGYTDNKKPRQYRGVKYIAEANVLLWIIAAPAHITFYLQQLPELAKEADNDNSR